LINQLTDKQKEKLKEYKEKYINIGLSTERIDRTEAEKNINILYEKILKKKKPSRIFFFDSPLQLWRQLSFYVLFKRLVLNKLKHIDHNTTKEVELDSSYQIPLSISNEVRDEVEKEVRDEVDKEVKNEVRDEVVKEVRNEVRDEVWNEVGNEVGIEVRDEVGKEVRNEVRKEVEKEVENEVRNEVGKEVWDEVWNEVRNEVRDEVGIEVRDEVRDEVEKEVRDEVGIEVGIEVRDEVRDEVSDEVGEEVWNEVWNEVGNEVRKEVEKEVRDEVWNEARNEVRNEVGIEVWKEVGKEVRNEVRNEVWKEVENEVWKEVGKEVKNEVSDEVGIEVWNEVGKEVWNEVGIGVRDEVRDEVEKEVKNEVGDEVGNVIKERNGKKRYLIDFCSPYLFGCYDSYYFSYYSFFKDECSVKYKCVKKYEIYEKLCELSFVYPLKNVCFVSEKPIEINIKDKHLHADGKPALKYSDGFGLYRLNGIDVPKWLVLDNAERIDPKKFVEIKNVEVRREFVRKVGIDRIVHELGAKLLEKSEDGVYELLNFDWDGKERIFLKMINPSMKCFHVEGVAIECKTIRQALAWRNQEEEMPVVLT